jgi:hypothetical protein
MHRFFSKLGPALAIVATAAIYAGVASGHDGGSNGDNGGGDRHGRDVLRASLAPSMPGDPAFHGVTPGAAPWVLARGDVRVKLRGRFEVKLRGLVIPNPPGDGTTGPVHSVSASLYCGADSETAAADTTPSVPISARGNARIRDRSFNVPATCLAPIVLVHPNGDATKYIAVSGWRR